MVISKSSPFGQCPPTFEMIPRTIPGGSDLQIDVESIQSRIGRNVDLTKNELRSPMNQARIGMRSL